MSFPLLKIFPVFLRRKIEGREDLQKIVGNMGWLFMDKVTRLASGLVIGVWLARYLGPEEFGLYNYAVAFVALFGAFTTLGLDGVVVREIVRNPIARDEILGTAFALRLIGGFIGLLITITAILLMHPYGSLAYWLVAIIAAGMIFQAFDVIDYWFQTQVQSKYTVYAKNAALFFIVLVKAALILYHAPLIAFAWAYLAETILVSLAMMIVYRINGHFIKFWHVNLDRAKSLLRDSWPLILSSLAIMVYMRIDQVMIGEMIGTDAVGIYSAAISISEVWYFIPMAITASVFPVIIHSKKISEELYRSNFQRLYDLMVWLALIVAVPMTFYADSIINILYGSQYNQAGTVLTIHIWGSVFVFLGVTSGRWFLAENMNHIFFRRTLAGGVVNVILNFILIPVYGIRGAAIATLISQASAAYFGDIFNSATRELFFMKTKSLCLINLIKKVTNG